MWKQIQAVLVCLTLRLSFFQLLLCILIAACTGRCWLSNSTRGWGHGFSRVLNLIQSGHDGHVLRLSQWVCAQTQPEDRNQILRRQTHVDTYTCNTHASMHNQYLSTCRIHTNTQTHYQTWCSLLSLLQQQQLLSPTNTGSRNIHPVFYLLQLLSTALFDFSIAVTYIRDEPISSTMFRWLKNTGIVPVLVPVMMISFLRSLCAACLQSSLLLSAHRLWVIFWELITQRDVSARQSCLEGTVISNLNYMWRHWTYWDYHRAEVLNTSFSSTVYISKDWSFTGVLNIDHSKNTQYKCRCQVPRFKCCQWLF